MKKYIACLLVAILLLTMLPASASAEGGMQACHRVTAKYTDSKQSNKSGIRLWSVKTALMSVDDEINGLAQAYADKIAPTLQAGKANGDKNSRLDVEIRHSKTGLTWMSFLVQARTTYHRDLIAQEFTSRTFDMTTGERILLTDIFPEGSEGCTASAIRISGDGRRLYVSNRGRGGVCVFDVDGARLSRAGYISCGEGGQIREFNFVGSWLLCADEKGHTVSVFPRNHAIGSAPVSVSEFKRVWCILPLE